MCSVIGHMLDVWCQGDKSLFKRVIEWLNDTKDESLSQPLIVCNENVTYMPEMVSLLRDVLEAISVIPDSRAIPREKFLRTQEYAQLRDSSSESKKRIIFVLGNATTGDCITLECNTRNSEYNDMMKSVFRRSNHMYVKQTIKLMASMSLEIFSYFINLHLAQWRIAYRDVIPTNKGDYILTHCLYRNYLIWCYRNHAHVVVEETFLQEFSGILRDLVTENEFKTRIRGFFISDLVSGYKREKLRKLKKGFIDDMGGIIMTRRYTPY